MTPPLLHAHTHSPPKKLQAISDLRRQLSKKGAALLGIGTSEMPSVRPEPYRITQMPSFTGSAKVREQRNQAINATRMTRGQTGVHKPDATPEPGELQRSMMKRNGVLVCETHACVCVHSAWHHSAQGARQAKQFDPSQPGQPRRSTPSRGGPQGRW